MENSLQYVASESFSYSWLLNKNPSSSSIDTLTNHNEDITFLNYSKRFLELEPQNFNFDVNPVSLVHADDIFSDGHIMPIWFDSSPDSSYSGSFSATGYPYIMPLYVNTSNNGDFKETFCNFDTCSITSTPSTQFSPYSASNREEYGFFKKQRKICSKVLIKRFKFFWLFCKSLGRSRKGSKVDDFDTKVLEIDWDENGSKILRKKWQFGELNLSICAGSEEESNHKSLLYTTLPHISAKGSFHDNKNLRNSPETSLDMENTISEAILHCKRSFGMLTESEVLKGVHL